MSSYVRFELALTINYKGSQPLNGTVYLIRGCPMQPGNTHKVLINNKWQGAIIVRERPDIYEVRLTDSNSVIGIRKSFLKAFRPLPKGLGSDSPLIARFRAINYDELLSLVLQASKFLDPGEVIQINQDGSISDGSGAVTINAGTMDQVTDEFIEEVPAWVITLNDPYVGTSVVAKCVEALPAAEAFTKAWYHRKATLYFDAIRLSTLSILV
jgi:hypothetical protein